MSIRLDLSTRLTHVSRLRVLCSSVPQEVSGGYLRARTFEVLRIILVAAARPNFMKIAPILRALKRYPHLFEPFLVHTDQHYDWEMSAVFFHELGLPEPDRHLGVGSGTQAVQTGRAMIAFEEVLLDRTPDCVLVVGDVNSTLACALCAAKLRIPVAHVEAGLRSFDRSMPEEINRVVTD